MTPAQSETRSGGRFVPLALLTAVVVVSFAAIFFRKAQPTHPIVMAGLRLAAAAVMLSPWTIRAIARKRLGGRLLRHAALAGLFYSVHFGAWVSSLSLTGIAASVTIVTTTPLLLAVWGRVTKKDEPDRRLWFAIALGTLGMLLVGGMDLRLGAGRLAGDALAFLGAAAIAGYFLVGRRLGDEMDLPVFSGVATAVGAAVLLAAALVAGIPIRAASTEAYVYLFLAAIFPQLVGHNLLTWCLRHARPANVAMAVVGEPVGSTFIARLWLGEKAAPMTLFGCAVILSSIILSLVSRSPDSKSKS